MNIVIATSKLKSNGAVVYARRVIPQLAARGHRVWLAASPGSWIAERTAGELPLVPTDFRRLPLGEVSRLAAFCRRNGIDLFHSHSTRASHFGAMLQTLHGIPSVAHLHSSTFEAHVWFHRLVIAVSLHTLARHRGRLAGLGGRGVVLPNFVDTRTWRPASGPDRLRELLGVASDVPVLLVAGQICRTKGQDLAVRCLEIVRRSHASAVLVLAGHGRPRRWHRGPGVHVLGYREDLHELLPHATVVLVPSRREAFGLAAAEAMACGVPVVAADAGGVSEVVAGGAGKLVPVGDVRALAGAVGQLLDDPAARRRLADAGERAVVERYALASHLDALEHHYRVVAGVTRGEDGEQADHGEPSDRSGKTFPGTGNGRFFSGGFYR
jgi:glycosyltransferase involved in cell wall biosynthesis